jgi:hypothetical protein
MLDSSSGIGLIHQGGARCVERPPGRVDPGGDSFNSLAQSSGLSFLMIATVLSFLKPGLQTADFVPPLRQF